MKHLIAVTMCLVLSISVLSGCGSSKESTGSKEKADSLNESGRAFFDSVKDQIKIFFVTTSNYIGGKQ